MSSGRIEHARSKISFTVRCVAYGKRALDKIRLMCVCDGPTFHRSRRQAGRTHTHTQTDEQRQNITPPVPSIGYTKAQNTPVV